MAFQDFDLISQRRQLERRQRLKKRIIIGLLSIVVVLLMAAASVCAVTYMKNQEAAKRKQKDSDESPGSGQVHAAEEVKAVCAGTDYKQTCEDSILKAVAKNSAPQPIDILEASFTVAFDEINGVLKKVSALKYSDKFKQAALEDCLVLLDDAVDELNRSVSSVQGKDKAAFSSKTPDVNNWLSAVLSYEETCIDGFPDGAEKAAMKKLLMSSKEHGSNALAIVSNVFSVFATIKGSGGSQRKLLGLDVEGYPTWMSRENRRNLGADPSKFTPNVTVAKDGSGNYTTISKALDSMPETYKGRYVIYVKEGVYEESVVVKKNMVNLTIFGDGSQKSVVTGSKNYVDGTPTFRTATFAVLGEGFLAQSIGFRNTAGPEKLQAVALRVQADRAIFVNCRMQGYQATLYVQAHRQFYRSCYITGTIDFIFGDAAAVFQNCMLYVRRPMDNQQNTVTCHGRLDKRQTTGFVIQNSHILADAKLEPEKDKFKSFLGRPSKEYSRTIIMETEIGDLIQPVGWLEWNGNFALTTLYYAEFNNKGAGANTAERVKWHGFKVIDKKEAVNFTVGPFLQGESWLKIPNVPVRFGMYTK
ncbi:putative pectinesterase/pectinesterase inhibitor 13 [Sesamum alatum]|uniref:Pectinesterase n=1 Tax=Sesamum alatum TaxID=300844 RepID=A0AAE1YEW1_9LAMI|nr:putative pectinesterase/pectinesterase inhibitor 13 [Sesamum alatum]